MSLFLKLVYLSLLGDPTFGTSEDFVVCVFMKSTLHKGLKFGFLSLATMA